MIRRCTETRLELELEVDGCCSWPQSAATEAWAPFEIPGIGGQKGIDDAICSREPAFQDVPQRHDINLTAAVSADGGEDA